MSNTRFWRDALTSGSAASLLSLLALMLEGRRENASAAAPIKAVSHWLHGPRAYTVNRTTWAHTAVGASVHCVSAILWGGMYGLLLRRIAARREEALHRRRPRAGAPAPEVTVPEAVASTAVVTAVAALTDLRLVPPRLTPGFENRLSATAVAAVYLAFGAGLALAGIATGRSTASVTAR